MLPHSTSSPAAEAAGCTLKRAPHLPVCVAHASQDDEKVCRTSIFGRAWPCPTITDQEHACSRGAGPRPAKDFFSILFSVQRRTSVRRHPAYCLTCCINSSNSPLGSCPFCSQITRTIG